MSDTTHTILHSAKRFFSGTVCSRISGMLRDIAMAFAFGTQGAVAAFMIAFRFAHLLRRLFGEGALQSAFVPEFETFRQESPQKAFSFFRDLYFALSLFLSAIIIFSALILGVFVSFIDLSPGNLQIIVLTLLMLPSLLFICLYGLNASLLQCEKSYFLPGIAPVAFNLIWIIAVLSFQFLPISEAMIYLAISVNVACFAQWYMTVPHTWRIYKQQLIPLQWQISHHHPELISLCKALGLGILGVAATQINSALDAVFARYADEEGPAFLWYAIRVQQLPLALFGVAIGSALLPPLTRAIKSGDKTTYCHFYSYAFEKTTALILPITGALLAMGDSIINLIYGRGDFENHSVALTTYCLWAYSVGLLPSALILISAPAFYAQSHYKIPALGSVLAMVLNFGLNMWFIAGLKWGATSVALATSLSAWVNYFFLNYWLKKRGDTIAESLEIFKTCQILIATAIAAIAVYLFRTHYLNDFILIDMWNGITPIFPDQFTSQFFDLSIESIVFFGTFFGISTLCNWKKSH